MSSPRISPNASPSVAGAGAADLRPKSSAAKPNPPPRPELDSTSFPLIVGALGSAAVAAAFIIPGLWRHFRGAAPEALPTPPQDTSLQASQPPPQATRATQPGFADFEAQGDIELGSGEVALAMHSYMEALRDLFSKIENLGWTPASERPMPHAPDVARLRQKLANLVKSQFQTYEGDPDDLVKALLYLGPDVGKQVVAELLEGADTMGRADRLRSVLEDARFRYNFMYIAVDAEVDDQFAAEHVQSLQKYIELSVAGLDGRSVTDQYLGEVADAYLDLWNLVKDDPSYPNGADMLRMSAVHYLHAIQLAAAAGDDATDYNRTLTALLADNAEQPSEFRFWIHGLNLRLVLRLLDGKMRLGHQFQWAEMTDRAVGTASELKRVGATLDAATQWFRAGDNDRTTATLRNLVEDSAATAVFDAEWRLGKLGISPVAAALKLFRDQLETAYEDGHKAYYAVGFDLLQRYLAELVDSVIRTAAPATPGPTLVDRLDPEVLFSAALTEVMQSPGAPLAMDEAVGFLQAGRLRAFDPVEIRKALKGEVVSMDLALALNDAIPVALRPAWREYAEDKDAERAEREGAEKRAAADPDRDAERDSMWRPDMVPVGAPPIL